MIIKWDKLFLKASLIKSNQKLKLFIEIQRNMIFQITYLLILLKHQRRKEKLQFSIWTICKTNINKLCYQDSSWHPAYKTRSSTSYILALVQVSCQAFWNHNLVNKSKRSQQSIIMLIYLKLQRSTSDLSQKTQLLSQYAPMHMNGWIIAQRRDNTISS